MNYIKLVDIGGSSFSIDEKFDIVSAFDVLFHIVDDQLYGNALKNINTRLTHIDAATATRAVRRGNRSLERTDMAANAKTCTP